MTTQTSKREMFILTPRELHFGFLKETFHRGTVISFDKDHGTFLVDGRRFSDHRDLDILRRQAVKHPDSPWIVPYSEENLELYTSELEEPPMPVNKKPIDHMLVVESDEDLIESIDISHTKVAEKNREQREAQRNRKQPEKMEVIRGDESAEERIARLNQEKKGDINSIAERVALKQKTAAKMPIVHDDSLGMAGGSKAAALNAGQPLPSRDDIDAKKEEARLLAEARKKQVEGARASAAQLDGIDPDDLNAEIAHYPVTTPDVKDASERIAQLKAEIAALEASTEKPERVPVTDPDKAQQVMGDQGNGI